MARRKTSRSSKKNRVKLLPQFVSDFIYAQSIRTLSIVTGCIGLFILIALISYSSSDPSINTSVGYDETINNWGYLLGAYLADFAVQTLGWASYLIGFAFLSWSYFIIKHGLISSWWARLATLFVSVICASMASIPLEIYNIENAYGTGSLGILSYNLVSSPIQKLGLPYSSYILPSIMGLIALSLLPYTSAFRLSEWYRGLKLVVNYIKFIAVTGYYYVRLGINRVIDFVKQLQPQESNDSEKQKKTRPAKPKLKKPKPVPVKPKADKLKAGKRAQEEKQPDFSFVNDNDYSFPPLNLLQDAEASDNNSISEDALQKNADMLQSVLEDFGVEGEITAVNPGPVVTLYEFEPAPGIKSSRIISLSDDIARSMAALSVRIAVVPGRSVIGIEIPNQDRETVFLRELLASKDYEETKTKLALVLGKDIAGKPVISDLAKMPHLLIAGTTGSGKSVGINAMIVSFLYRMSPEELRVIMIDPKMLELSVYDGIPHLLTPVVTDPSKAIVALKWAVREMEDRYRAMSKMGVRNIEGYNQKIRKARDKGEILTNKVQTGFDPDTGKPVFEEQPLDMSDLPYIVVVVDEMADLMLVAGKDVEAAIQRLAQMARAAGIHLIMATQRPSVDVITGTVKANFPSRISYQVTSRIDSRTILGDTGAEHLLGMGDMLFMPGGGRMERVHGPFVSDQEVEDIVDHLKKQGEPDYIDNILDESQGFGGDTASGAIFGDSDEVDELLDQAIDIVARSQKASTSYLQRQLSIGYNRAANLIDYMEEQEMIGPADHVGRRDVFLNKPEAMEG